MALPGWTKLFAAIFTDGADVIPSEARQWGLENETFLNASGSRANLIGGYLTATVAANVLTIAIKTLAGADPSSGDPVYIQFPNQAAATAATTQRTLTAANSLVVSAGSKLGFADAIPGRIWIVAFDDAGTVRLAAFNAYGGNTAATGATLFPLPPLHVASSTAEGGAGAADSAGVFYTGSAVTSKPFVVIGHLTWNTAMATAGNWSAAPDVIHMQRIGDARPGDVIQVQESVDGAVATGTTVAVADDTIPQSAEGVQFMTKAITPTSQANVLEMYHRGFYANSAAGQLIAALFQDATASALAATAQKTTAAGDCQNIVLEYDMLAGTVAATTFKIRTGGTAAGTTTFNGTAGARLFGGVGLSRLRIRELMA